MFKEAGLDDVTVTPHPVAVHFEFLELLLGGHLARAQEAGSLDSDDIAMWWEDLARANEGGSFLTWFTAFIVGGRKR